MSMEEEVDWLDENFNELLLNFKERMKLETNCDIKIVGDRCTIVGDNKKKIEQAKSLIISNLFREEQKSDEAEAAPSNDEELIDEEIEWLDVVFFDLIRNLKSKIKAESDCDVFINSNKCILRGTRYGICLANQLIVSNMFHENDSNLCDGHDLGKTVAERNISPSKNKHKLTQRKSAGNEVKVISFVDKKFFGPLIGKGGQNKGKLEMQFDVKLEFDNKEDSIKVVGSKTSCEEFEEYCKTYIERKNNSQKRYQNDDRLTNTRKNYKSTIPKSSPFQVKTDTETIKIDNDTLLISFIKKNKMLESCYDVKFSVDNKRKAIILRGADSNKAKFRDHLWFKLNQMENQSFFTKEFFFVGLKDNTVIVLNSSQNCINKNLNQHCKVTSTHNLRSFSKESFINTPGLRESLKSKLEKARQILMDDESAVCDTLIHLGLLHFNHLPGERKIAEIDCHSCCIYERLDDKYLNLQKLRDLPIRRNIVRYDMTILAKDISCRLRYKIYIDLTKGEFVNFREVGIDEREFYDIYIGPGYFTVKNTILSRFDIVELRKNLSTRVRIQISSNDEKIKEKIQLHGMALKSFFSNIKISLDSNTYNLDIPSIPKEYDIIFLRKSERKDYQYTTGNILRSSVETVIINASSSNSPDYISDLFFINEPLSAMLAEKPCNWNIDSILNKSEAMLIFISEMLSYILK